MRVTVNGEAHELDARASVADVVARLAEGRRAGIAVSVNGEVVPRGEWENVAVRDEDTIEVLSAIGGG